MSIEINLFKQSLLKPNLLKPSLFTPNIFKQWVFTILISMFIASCSSSSDTTGEAPVINNITVFQATDTTVTLEFNLRKTGTVYYVVQLGGSTPNVSQIKDGTGNGGTVADSGSEALSGGIRRASFVGLTASTTYTAYVVGEAADGGQTTVGSIEITTLAEPVFRIVDEIPLLESITIQYESDLTGTVFYLLQQGGLTPTEDQITNGSGNGGEVIHFSNANADVGQNNFIAINNLTGGTTYKIYLFVTNSGSGQTTPIISSSIRTFSTNDTTEPVITLNGFSSQNVIVGEAYVERGATAVDNRDGDITDKIIINTALLNTISVGTYNVTYTVTDSFQNTATVTRIVNVVDGSIPVITLLGNNPQTLSVGSVYTELNATAFDDRDGDLTNNIVINSTSVDTSTEGTYSVTYNVTDASGNAAQPVTRSVIVTPVAGDNNTFVSFLPAEIGISYDIKIDSTTAYIVGADGCSLFAVDVSDSSTPTIVAQYDTPFVDGECITMRAVEVSGNQIYLLGGGFWILDKSLFLAGNDSPALLEKTTDFGNNFGSLAGRSQSMKVVGDYLFTSGYITELSDTGESVIKEGVVVADISDPTQYLPVSSFALRGLTGSTPKTLEIKDDILYFKWNSMSSIALLDISDPLNIVSAGEMSTLSDAAFLMSDDKKYLFELKGEYEEEMSIFTYDISTPASPSLLSEYLVGERASSLTQKNGKLYLSTEIGILILDTTDASNLTQVDRIPFLASLTDAMAVLNEEVYSITKDDQRERWENRIDQPVSNYLAGSLSRVVDENRFTLSLATQDRYGSTVFDSQYIYLASKNYGVKQPDGSFTLVNGELTALDISDPVNPLSVSTSPINATEMELWGQWLITNETDANGDIQVIDVQDPTTPSNVAQYDHTTGVNKLMLDKTSDLHQIPTLYLKSSSSIDSKFYQADLSNLPTSLTAFDSVAGGIVDNGGSNAMASLVIQDTANDTKEHYFYYETRDTIKRASVIAASNTFETGIKTLSLNNVKTMAANKNSLFAAVERRASFDAGTLHALDWDNVIAGTNAFIDSLLFESKITNIFVDGQIAYVTTLAGVTLVNISDPTQLSEIRTIRTLYPVVDFALVDDLILIKDTKGLSIIDNVDLN